jgi:hypothetical protein
LSRIKNIVYKVILPIYLWSIGEKTLESYIIGIEQEFKLHNTNMCLSDGCKKDRLEKGHFCQFHSENLPF